MYKKNWKRLFLIGTAILITVAALWRYMEYQRMKTPDRTHPVMEITSNPKPFCIGRVMVDLPQGLHLDSPSIAPYITNELIWSELNIKTQTHISLEEFNQIVADRWAEVQTYTHDSYKNAYAKPSEHYKIRESGWLFSFNHEKMESNVRMQPNGENLFDIVIYYDAESYFWDKGTMFIVKGKGTEANQRIQDLVLRTRHLAAGEIPQEAGICLNGGFIQSHYRSGPEYLIWSMKLPDDGLSLSIFTGTDVRDKGFLDRGIFNIRPTYTDKDDDGDHIKSGTVYRAAHRTEDHLPADEIVAVETEAWLESPPSFKTQAMGRWEFIGSRQPKSQPYPVSQPYVRFDISFTTKSEHRPESLEEYPEQTATCTYPSKEEFMALWDAIVSTIRFYPSALTPAPAPPPKEVIPGPSAQQTSRDKQALDDFLDEG